MTPQEKSLLCLELKAALIGVLIGTGIIVLGSLITFGLYLQGLRSACP